MRNNTTVRGTDEDYLLINNIIKTSQMINAPGQEHATTQNAYYNKFLDMNSIDDLVQELHDILRHKHDISDEYIRASIELYVSYLYLGFKAENDIYNYLVKNNTNINSSLEFVRADKLHDSLYAIDIFMTNSAINVDYMYDDYVADYTDNSTIYMYSTIGIQIKPYKALIGFSNNFNKAVSKLETAKNKSIIEQYVFMFYYDDYIIAHKKRDKSRKKASRYFLGETSLFYTEAEIREIMCDYSSIYELQQSNEFEFIPMTKPRKPKRI